MSSYDVLVIGGGIAGVSIAYELATDRSVGLLEMERTLAFHTTGRSVATFLESYGGRTIRALTSASRAFMEAPPDGFGRPLLKSLPLVWVAPHGEESDIAQMRDEVAEFVPSVELLNAREAAERTRVIRPDWVAAGLLEPGASEIDVAALHGGYARGVREKGGEIHASAEVHAMERRGSRWVVRCASGETHDATIVVNAAGSWCDRVAGLSGALPIDIRPLRRTVFTVSPPTGIDAHDLPLVGDVSGTFYFKPEGPQILCSPADEVPSEPCDAKPEEVDIARAIEVINAATTLDIRHVRSSWAGLRNFVADRVPVVGFDNRVDDFFWFAGQGGYGIQIAPALARAAASLIRTSSLPGDLVARGVVPADLARERLNGLGPLTTH